MLAEVDGIRPVIPEVPPRLRVAPEPLVKEPVPLSAVFTVAVPLLVIAPELVMEIVGETKV